MYVYWYKLLYITRFHAVWQKILHFFFMIGCRRGGDIAPREEWRRQRGTGQGRYEDPEADPERDPGRGPGVDQAPSDWKGASAASCCLGRRRRRW